MSETDKLKETVEKLSEHEIQKIKLLKEISRLTEDAELAKINEMPLLYRMEIQKALDEYGENEIASKIVT
ncbi:MAG: hypothetical protein MUP58_02750 [Candidatus Nanohaloarchaeota archaeon QJJ-9]|nr:hypothetical protein [Candidatus Nanohaloarchaeota archaeon QJJ-9]